MFRLIIWNMIPFVLSKAAYFSLSLMNSKNLAMALAMLYWILLIMAFLSEESELSLLGI